LEVLKMATKTLQLAIQSAVDGVRTVVDAIKSTTDSTATKVNAIDVKVGSLLDGRVVKSVQRGTSLMTSNNGGSNALMSVSAVISPVNMSKSKVESTFHFPLGPYSFEYHLSNTLVSSTSIKFQMYMLAPASAYQAHISWQIIEFY